VTHKSPLLLFSHIMTESEMDVRVWLRLIPGHGLTDHGFGWFGRPGQISNPEKLSFPDLLEFRIPSSAVRVFETCHDLSLLDGPDDRKARLLDPLLSSEAAKLGEDVFPLFKFKPEKPSYLFFINFHPLFLL
jgi:hypothetical protein